MALVAESGATDANDAGDEYFRHGHSLLRVTHVM